MRDAKGEEERREDESEVKAQGRARRRCEFNARVQKSLGEVQGRSVVKQ